MGLSTAYGNMILFIFVLSLLSVLVAVFAGYMTETAGEAKAQGRYLKERLDTSVSISSMTTSGNDVVFLVINDGKTVLDVNETDFYLDRTWIDREDMDELVILNTTFDPGVWNPDESVKMRVTYDTDDGQPHEGRVVTGNGVSDSMIFYKTG